MTMTEDLTKRLMEAVGIYESATDAKSRYQAESQVCRIAGRLGPENVGIIYGQTGAYIPQVERFGEHRIPKLQTVLTQDQLNKIALEQRVSNSKWNVSISFVPGIDSDFYSGRARGVRLG